MINSTKKSNDDVYSRVNTLDLECSSKKGSDKINMLK